jgi:hypothetical protein
MTRYLLIIIFLSIGFSCRTKAKTESLFVALDHTATGIEFTNRLTPTPEFNMFKYMYFYNGAGVGAGDFNNDGLIDLFFSSNQSDNKIFLNEGNLKFKDVTAESQIVQDKGWSTGVSIVDINNDGLLDIYVCKVGNYEMLKSKNQLFVCKGLDKNNVPVYEEKAAEYGIDFSGFSTQAAFFDYDMDGDLDLFLLNHSVHQNGTFAERKHFIGTYHPLSGDRIFQNEGNDHFTDVTKQTGINSSAISYGLGICISDIDLNGSPDMYIGNDFHENDYLYINRSNGTFSEETTKRIMHTSQFSMGVDVADINNDAFPEIISMDMLPSDPYILKRSLGEDEFNLFNLKIGYGYNHQYARNNLQLNRRNGLFSEIGMYAGVFATDWSWAPLWMDFDNDGLKDLFVSNGIPKRLNDIDYVNYVSNSEIQQKIRDNQLGESDMALIDKFPQIKLPNKFFHNKGNAFFEDMSGSISGDAPTFSNGSVYADLDNDGDLDVIVNNIDDPVLIYQNRANDLHHTKSVSIHLKGDEKNMNALGSKVIVYSGPKIMTYEKYPVRGFQSSMEVPLHIGLNNVKVDSAVLIWPDNTYQQLNFKDSVQHLKYSKGLPSFNYESLKATAKNSTNAIADITKETNLNYKHEENPFVEFDREPLIPFMVSKDGPGLAVADINNDGTEDVFIGSAKTFKSAVFTQDKNGKFSKLDQPALNADSMYEDVDAAWVDVNGDKKVDLVVASGGNEFFDEDEHLTPRVYLNDGKGVLAKKANAFEKIYLTASCIKPFDFNNDGAVDLFVGGRAVPWEYGQIPNSYLLMNDGSGHFKNVTSKFAKDLAAVGFVKSGDWFDIDKDGDMDLLLTLEWGGIAAFINDKGTFSKKILTDKKGFWNFLLPCDIDNDGDIDLVAGNWGLNHRLKATQEQPVHLYYNDFDGNGKKEQLVTYYLGNKEIPFANKDELQKQVPILKKKFLYAEDFAKSALTDIFPKDKLKSAEILTADYLSNAVLINDGKMNFTVKALPWEAQLSPYKTGVVVNANNDALPDILLFGNFYENNIQMGRYDADFGTLLINKGNGNFTTSLLNGLSVKGQVRHISNIRIKDKPAFILAKNNDSVMIIKMNRDY